MTTLGRTDVIPQHLQALNEANRVRNSRARLKREIANGDKTVADVLDENPWEAATMTVGDLLLSQHRWGRHRALRLLRSIPMAETKTIGTMTERQRDALKARLDGLPVDDPFTLAAFLNRAA